MNGTITTEAEADALPIGTIIRDNMGDARQKLTPQAWEQTGVEGLWPTPWVALPALVLWTPPRTLYVVCGRLLDPETNEHCEFDGDVTFDNRVACCPGCRRRFDESEGEERPDHTNGSEQ